MSSRKTTYFCMVLALALAIQTLSSQNSYAQEIHWAPDVPTARRASMEYKVPVVLHFYGDNCLPCKVLEQNVLSRSEVIETLNKYFICVRVNASQDRETAAQYGVHSWPTDVFISPDGKTLDQGVCKQTAGEYLGVLHAVAVMNRDRNAMLAAEQSNNAQQVTSQVANYAQPAPQTTPPQTTPPQTTPPQANPPQAATTTSIAANGSIPSSTPAATGTAWPATSPGNASLANTQPGGAQPNVASSIGLPPAGQVAAGNPQGPNFYVQATSADRQQLPQSLAPNAGVTSGPVLSQDQPQAVSTAVQAAGNQVASASQQHALNTTLGRLPPMDTTAQIGPSLPSRSTDPLAALMSTAPSVPAAAVAAVAPPANAWNQPSHSGSSAGQSQMLDNPHYNSNPTSSPKIPTSTVSFQPRAALSPEANAAAKASAYAAGSALTGNHTDNASASSLQPTSTHSATVAASEPVSIALDGYCPVALQGQGNWIVGQPQFAVRHRGRIYQLSSQEAMQEFLRSPDRCSPVMSGYDAMTFLNEGKLVEGSIQHGLHDQSSGNILLFSSAESKQAYEQNFERNTQALNIVLQKAGVAQ